VLYSRKIWASNLLPLFLVGYVASGLLAFAEGRRRWVFVHLVLLSVIVQIHISSLALAPVTAVMLLLLRKRTDWRWVAAGLAAALALGRPRSFGTWQELRERWASGSRKLRAVGHSSLLTSSTWP
jgi:hypothetical protein